jgi:hypothetical protein
MNSSSTGAVAMVTKCLQTAMKLQEGYDQVRKGDKRAEQQLEQDYQRFAQDLNSLRFVIHDLEANHLKPLIQKIEISMTPLQKPAQKRSREAMMEEVVAKLFGEQLAEFVNHLYALREDAFRREMKVESVKGSSATGN